MVVAAVVPAGVPAGVPVAAGAVRLGLVAAAMAGFAAVAVDPAAVAAVAVLACLIFDGFMVNRLGVLSWHGAADGWRLLVLVAAATLGLAAGGGYRVLRERLVWRRRCRWLRAEALVADVSERREPLGGRVVPEAGRATERG